MEIEKIRNTTDAELRHQEHELSDQLFRLKFQMKMGQTESLKKIRGLRRDIARIKTVGRERELGIGINASSAKPTAVAVNEETGEPARARVVAKPAAAKSKPKAGAPHKPAKKSVKKTEKK